MNKFYITTTLPYVNANPHIGFALEIVQADVLARHQRQQMNEVFFNTGTDEHGLKIYRKAIEQGQETQSYCDKCAGEFKKLKNTLNLSYDNFIRTTDPHHILAAQEFWKRCVGSGDIYKKEYKTTYCVGCELEKTKSELVENKCPMHPSLKLEIIEEENYFFRYSKYQEQLLKLYSDNPKFVTPRHRLKEIIQFTKNGLEDFSISRLKEKMPWGVEVPGDSNHVMYVWFDALVSYISALGWPENKENFSAFWPGVQIAGKDNLRQQSSMWQAMLLSAGLPPSKEVIIHGFITADGQKMSKSLGNIIDPFSLVEKYGTDAVRYYLLREIPSTEDGDYSEEKFIARLNGDLANGIGNFSARVLTLAEKLTQFNEGPTSEIHKQVSSISRLVEEKIESRKLHEALSHIWELVSFGDGYINQTAPWKMEANSKEQITVLTNCLFILLALSTLLTPFLPASAELIKDAIIFDPSHKIQKANKLKNNLFQRV